MLGPLATPVLHCEADDCQVRGFQGPAVGGEFSCSAEQVIFVISLVGVTGELVSTLLAHW